MCIRDRDGVADEGEAVGNDRCAGQARQKAQDGDLVDAGGEGASAVSYTHLRAHETVLDLVCRLLLEKKKN